MKPVYQNIIGYGGNCFAACIASILHLDITEVPNFCADGHPDWWSDAQHWLVERGYFLLDIKYSAVTDAYCEVPNGVYVIIGGKSPRGDWNHAIIGISDKVYGHQIWRYVHDPYYEANGTWIVGEPQWIGFLIPMDIRIDIHKKKRGKKHESNKKV